MRLRSLFRLKRKFRPKAKEPRKAPLPRLLTLTARLGVAPRDLLRAYFVMQASQSAYCFKLARLIFVAHGNATPARGSRRQHVCTARPIVEFASVFAVWMHAIIFYCFHNFKFQSCTQSLLRYHNTTILRPFQYFLVLTYKILPSRPSRRRSSGFLSSDRPCP